MEGQRRNAQHRARPSVGYLLFQYQNELTRRNAEPRRLSRTKINIIDGLVSHTIGHLNHCSVEVLQACKRELIYKQMLRDQLKGMRRRRLPATNTRSRYIANVSKNTKTVTVKAPSTPPKPKSFGGGPLKMSLFDEEIFV